MNHANRRARAITLGSATALAVSALSASAGTYTNDFSAGADGLTIYTLSGAAPEVRTSGGNPDGYLKLTDAVGGTSSTVIFPDFDGGFPVQAFTFEVDCRIGNGTANPADGFSINFARSGDPVLASGAGYVNGAAEDGTTTGLSVGFDTYDNGNGDVIGFSIKLDGAILTEIAALTKNGAIDDPLSLQTGPVGSAGWAHFKVELKTDGNLDVTWKGTKVVDNYATGWVPSGGRIVFAARTGGEWQEHHFDNVAIATTPAPVAAVTSATVNDTGYHFKISDFGGTSVVTPADVGDLLIDGTTVTPTSVTKAGTVTTVTYVPAAPVVNRSAHTYTLDFEDQSNVSLSGAGTINAPALPSTPLLGATVAGAGYWTVREIHDAANGGALDPFDIGTAAGVFADPPASSDVVDQAFVDYINFSDPQSRGDRGKFKLDSDFLTNTDQDDNNIIQGANIKLSVTGTTPAELQRTFWVQSDDCFALRVTGAAFTNKSGGGFIDPAESATLIFPGGTGNSNTRGLVQFPAAGDYVVEFLYAEGAGGAFNEVAWTNGDFVNNPDSANWTLVGGPDVAPLLADPLPQTPTGAPAGQWNLREIRNSGSAGDLAAAIFFTSNTDFTQPDGTSVVTDGVVPVLNYNDLDGGRGATGLFTNDLGLLGNVAGEDDQYIVAGRISLPVPAAGYYTLAGTVDDGFAVKIVSPGGRFVSTAGPGGLDGEDDSTFTNPAYSDTPTLAVAYFDAAGSYDVLFISQEGGGGSSGELIFAQGAFGTIGGTNTWQLLGTSDGIAPPAPLLPAVLPGPDGIDGAFGIRFIRGVAGQGDNIYNAVNSVLATPGNGGVNSDGTATYLNFSDIDSPTDQTNAGLFRSNNTDNGGLYAVADRNYLDSSGATGVEDDQIVAVAKGRVVIPTTGEWTFGIHSDDGVALRVDGAVWKRVSGDNWIDPASLNTVFFRNGTGDSNLRAVTDLAAGEHAVELIWFEGGGGSSFELYAAPGAINNDADATTWALVGDEAGGGLQLVASVPVVPDSGFAVSSVSYNALTSDVTINFPSEAGVDYGVEWSTQLTDTPWQSAGNVSGASGSTTTMVNAAALNGGTAPQRFFVRVRRP